MQQIREINNLKQITKNLSYFQQKLIVLKAIVLRIVLFVLISYLIPCRLKCWQNNS